MPREAKFYKIIHTLIIFNVHFFRDHWLYFLMNLRYSSNEILPLLSVSILSKFQRTISSVIGIFKGLKVSSISLLNSAISMRSSSFPWLGFLALTALSPKKWENWIRNVLHIPRRWSFHPCWHQSYWSANQVVPGWCRPHWLQDCQQAKISAPGARGWSCCPYRRRRKWVWTFRTKALWGRVWAVALDIFTDY